MIETYIPLYRKYRPQAFADVVGQLPIMQTLGNALTLGKVAHAYLLCGPRGTGKTSTARIFAKSLNCEQGPTLTPCQACASCTGITLGNALDVVEFDAASNSGVEDARELIENAQFTPMAGKFKIYIIDEVHMLSNSAFNALLKTLEEPPPNVVFIFATTEAHKVLPTIISRCQRFDFTRITTADIVARLQQIAKAESIKINEESLHVIARHSRGGMRDAVGLLDQVGVLSRADAKKTISRQDVASFIGALEEEVLVGIADALAQKDASTLLSQISDLSNRGTEPAQLVKELTSHFRNLLLVAATNATLNPGDLDLPADYLEKLTTQTKAFSPEELPQILSRLAAIERNIRHTQQPLLWLEVGLIEIAHREEIHVVQNLAERVQALEAQLANGAVPPPAAPLTTTAVPARQTPAPTKKPFPAPATTPKPVPLQPTAAAPVSETPPAGSPANIYDAICQKVASPPTKAMLVQQAFLISASEDRLVIGCASTAILEVLKKPEKFIHVRKAVEKHFGREMTVDLVLEKEAPTPVATTKSEPAPKPGSSPAQGNTAVLEAEAPPVATRLEATDTDPDLAEAKQHAMDMLQGKVLD